TPATSTPSTPSRICFGSAERQPLRNPRASRLGTPKDRQACHDPVTAADVENVGWGRDRDGPSVAAECASHDPLEIAHGVAAGAGAGRLRQRSPHGATPAGPYLFRPGHHLHLGRD